MVTEILKISIIAFMFCALGTDGMIFHFYQDWIRNLPWWIRNPIGGCYMCFTGEVCFWYSLVTHHRIIDILFFASAGIFAALIYKFAWTFLTMKIKEYTKRYVKAA
jgi:cell shape-determining protein MreD